MAITGVGFRWLDILEKEFDKACVELDTSLTDLETEEPEVVFSARQKIATLSSCFAQLTHKALTIFQNSAKLEARAKRIARSLESLEDAELRRQDPVDRQAALRATESDAQLQQRRQEQAELVDMRAELVYARAASAGGCQDSGDGAGNVLEAARARAEAAQLARENAALRETMLALHSELFGARLATKYLDKELAGRIQQLQLLGRDMRAEVRDSLWAQVEAEILLQRHKTLVRVCRGVSPRPAAPPAPPAPRQARARPRTVRVRRSPHLGLGISVTGGREHGVPILISELEAGGPAALTGELYVGDAILAINELDLTQACHKEAVQALQSVKGDCALCVQFIATDDEDRLSEDNYRFPLYPEDGEVFGAEPDGSGATPTAPRTPEYNRRACGADSGSECSSAGEGVRAMPAGSPPPYAPRYPDYNSLNNNLAILDMDDDNIKIEARLELAESDTKPLLIKPAALYSSSPPSTPHSSPAHALALARRQTKKKRKPQDWRTKGAYRAVEPDAASSDEPQREPPPPPRAPAAELQVKAPSPPPPPAAPHEIIVSPAADAEPKLIRYNGDVKPVRRESKGFRIGTARRVTEPAPLTNGKFPSHLLPGDGDPDFGTPV